MDPGPSPFAAGRSWWRRVLVLAACCCATAVGFEVFAEQQIVKLKPNYTDLYADYNNTVYGSTFIDDYFAKTDIVYSPLAGWSLNKYVRMGCFTVQWTAAPESAYISLLMEANKTAEDCTLYCNGTQAYYLKQTTTRRPTCRCAVDDSAIGLIERFACTDSTWDIFRQYDYRSSMSPSAYDVARRFLYQMVTVRMPNVDPTVRHYIHAINVFENRPKFDFDLLLEYPVFNAVWDFKKSRLVALSWYPLDAADDQAQLYFTVVTYNTTRGGFKVTQTHTLIQDAVIAEGSQLSLFTSVDGMGTVDILYGTYYSVVPAVLQTSPQVVHVIVAIDIDRKVVLKSVTLPVTLMNMQINALKHVLYGAGADLSDPDPSNPAGLNLAYYQLCTATNITKQVGDVTLQTAEVTCDLKQLGELPSQVNHMYLQSASMDHVYNYAWFMYKQESTGPPLALEYHQNDASYIRWKDESFPLEAAFTSLIQTVPRIIFTLYPPLLDYVKFDSSGTKIWVQFTSPTLQGAIPVDADGDGIPDYYNEADRQFRNVCEMFLDDFTMEMLPGSMCNWVSDSRFFIEVTLAATIMPGDLVRVRPNNIYAGKVSPGGVFQFSQPSTDFKPVLPPDVILQPVADVSGMRLIDACTDLYLNGDGSRDYGYRGPFRWSLDHTEPAAPEPVVRSIAQLLRDQLKQDRYGNPHSMTIPKGILNENVTYYFMLTVTSLFDPAKKDTKIHAVFISPTPVPPVTIAGATRRTQFFTREMSLVGQLTITGCITNLTGFETPVVEYRWIGCSLSDVVPAVPIPGIPAGVGGIEGCLVWNYTSLNEALISGKSSKTLLVDPFGMKMGYWYAFTLQASVKSPYTGEKFGNAITVYVQATASDFQTYHYGGNAFVTPITRPVVVDLKIVEQGCHGPPDWYEKVADSSFNSSELCKEEDGSSMFNYTCTVVATGLPCDLVRTDLLPQPSDNGIGLDPGLGLDTGGGGVSGGRRLAVASELLEELECIPVLDSAGKPVTFTFRGQAYPTADNITSGTLTYGAYGKRYCMQYPGKLLIQKQVLKVGTYRFDINVSKTYRGLYRQTSASIFVTIIQGTEDEVDTRFPEVALILESPLPVVPSQVIRLRGLVTNPQAATTYTYKWRAFRYSANPLYDPDQDLIDPTYSVPRYLFVEMLPPVIDFTNPVQFRTPPGVPYMAINPFILSPGVQYKLRLEATDLTLQAQNSSYATGFAEYAFLATGLPPSGGWLEVDRGTGIGFLTNFRLEMVGWGSEDIPLRYQFTYNRDISDPFSEPTLLQTVFSEQTFMYTRLPFGAVAPNYIVQVQGFVVTSLGVGAYSNTVQVMVRPPPNATIYQRIFDEVKYLDPETALTLGIMLAQAQTPANPASVYLNDTLYAIAVNGGAFNPAVVPKVASILQSSTQLLQEMCMRGLRTQQLISLLEGLVNRSLAAGYISTNDALVVGTTNLALALYAGIDSCTPGVVTEQAPTSGGRRLEMDDAIEARPAAERYDHLMQLRKMDRRIGTPVLGQLYPSEVPATFLTRGEDYYFGKDYTVLPNGIKPQGAVRETFDIPVLGTLAENYSMEVFTYRYLLFKKFPYTFWDIPPRHEYTVPADDGDQFAERVPAQGYSPQERLWHAMRLEMGNQNGDSIADELEAVLANTTFNRLPKVAASAAVTQQKYGTIDHAATCYYVGLSNPQALPHFDNRGVTLDRESCVSTKIADWVVFIDDLPKEIEVFEVFAKGAQLSVDEDRPATAAVGALLITILVGLAAGAFGIYVDEKQHAVPPIDLSKKRVVDLPDPREKLIATLAYNFRRNHLIVGLTTKHRKLTREKRVWIILVIGLATESLATVLHVNSLVRFRATTQFVATGLTVGVLLFPLMVFMQFLYEWRPMTRVHSVAPPRSAPPSSLDSSLKPKELAMNRSLFQPKRPHVPLKIRPPPKTAPPRIPPSSTLSLPVMRLPLDLPALKVGDGSKKIAPPPRRPLQKPRPPEGPPPQEHLLASRPPGGLGDTTMSSLSDALASMSSPGPFGLTLPELPPLLQGSMKTVVGKDHIPAPPPKRPGAGPKPPQAPPPLSKMFFAAPKVATLRVPPLPPAKAVARGPTLPPLPNIRPPQEVLSSVRQAGDLTRRGSLPPPPPPPPPKFGQVGQITAPETPREGDEAMFCLPGATTTPRFEEVRAPRATASRLASPAASGSPPPSRSGGSATGSDFESTRPPQAAFSLDPEHTMAPPTPASSSSPSTDRRRPPSVPPPARGQGGLPGLKALPPTPASRNQGYPAGSPSSALVPLPPKAPRPQPQPQSQLPLAVPMPLPKPPPTRGGTELAMVASPTSAQAASLQALALQLTPMRSVPGGGGGPGATGRIPALPKHMPLELPAPIAAKIPAVQRDVGIGLLPPPPPPPVGGFGALANMPVAPEAGEPTVMQRLAVYKAPPRWDGSAPRLPQPPPRPPVAALLPTPPSGPPPAHAIVLARRAGVPGFDEAAIVARAKPPPSSLVVRPPQEPPEPRADVVALVDRQAVESIARQRAAIGAPPSTWALPLPPILGIEDPFAQARKDPQGVTAMGKRAHDEKAPTPIPDYIVQGSLTAVQTFMLLVLLASVAIITIWGTYLPPEAVLPTYAATIVGMVVNMGLFESVKCVVITCLAIVHDETEKREGEIQARKLRMELKAQRIQQRGLRFMLAAPGG